MTRPTTKAILTSDSMTREREIESTSGLPAGGGGRIELEAELSYRGSVDPDEKRHAGRGPAEGLAETLRHRRAAEPGGDLQKRPPGRIALLVGTQARAQELEPSFEVDDAAVHLTVSGYRKRQVRGVHARRDAPIQGQEEIEGAARHFSLLPEVG